MAFFRATESARPSSQRLFTDPFALHFLRPSLRRAAKLCQWPFLAQLVNWYTDRRLPGARTSAIARTALIDDALRDALGSNIPQVVILGAGFDCRAYRLPHLESTAVFEADHPATLATKLASLRQVFSESPDNVRYVEIDFNQQTVPDVLARAGFQSSRPAVFLWEGVSHYLTPEAVDSVLRFVASCSAGTRLVFTYIHAGLLDGSVQFEGGERLLRDVARLSEPWIFGLVPSRLTEFLRERGLRLDQDFSANEYRKRYFGAAAVQMKGYEFYHVAIVRVS